MVWVSELDGFALTQQAHHSDRPPKVLRWSPAASSRGGGHISTKIKRKAQAGAIHSWNQIEREKNGSNLRVTRPWRWWSGCSSPGPDGRQADGDQAALLRDQMDANLTSTDQMRRDIRRQIEFSRTIATTHRCREGEIRFAVLEMLDIFPSPRTSIGCLNVARAYAARPADALGGAIPADDGGALGGGKQASARGF